MQQLLRSLESHFRSFLKFGRFAVLRYQQDTQQYH
jgi:hypothetical protein